MQSLQKYEYFLQTRNCKLDKLKKKCTVYIEHLPKTKTHCAHIWPILGTPIKVVHKAFEAI